MQSMLWGWLSLFCKLASWLSSRPQEVDHLDPRRWRQAGVGAVKGRRASIRMRGARPVDFVLSRVQRKGQKSEKQLEVLFSSHPGLGQWTLTIIIEKVSSNLPSFFFFLWNKEVCIVQQVFYWVQDVLLLQPCAWSWPVLLNPECLMYSHSSVSKLIFPFPAKSQGQTIKA